MHLFRDKMGGNFDQNTSNWLEALQKVAPGELQKYLTSQENQCTSHLTFPNGISSALQKMPPQYSAASTATGAVSVPSALVHVG